MNKKFNYYKILNIIKDIKSDSKEVLHKTRIVRQIIENYLYHQFSLYKSINMSPICKQSFYNYVLKINNNSDLLINKSTAPIHTRLKYNWDEIVSFAIKKRNQKYKDIKLDIRSLTNIVNSKFNISISHTQLSSQINKRTKKKKLSLPLSFKKFEVFTPGYLQMDGINPHKHMKLDQKMHIYTAIDQYSRTMFAYCYD